MNESNTQRVALVSGANKGIGLEIVRRLAELGLKVWMGARDEARGTVAAAPLRERGLDVEYVRLDVDDPDSIASALHAIESADGRLDVLVNNAGVFKDPTTSIFDLDVDTVRSTLNTNVLGPFLLIQAAVKLMKRNGYGRIVNLSSTLGSIAHAADPKSPFAPMLGPAYRLSKAALNSLTVLFAKELRGSGILVNAACPGWVKTDMGGPQAPLTPEQGADTPVWLATLPDDGPTAGFFNRRKPVPW